MEKKIINLKKCNEGSCLTCGKNDATIKLSINRIKYDDSIITFHICDECLAKMQKDIEVCE